MTSSSALAATAAVPLCVREAPAPYAILPRSPAATLIAVTPHPREALTAALERRTALDRALALGLAQLWDDESYRTLGYVRAVDFARETLGMREGAARRMAKLGRALRDIPELDAAFAGGVLCASKVVELARVIDSETPLAERHAWIARARSSTVSALRAAVRRELAGANQEAAGNAAEDETDRLTIAAPAHVGELWRHAKEAARRRDGTQLSPLACAESIAAEYLARVGDESTEVSTRLDRAHRHERRVDESVELLKRHRRALRPWLEGEDDVRLDERGAAERPIVDVPGVRINDDAWQRARTLEWLIAQRRQVRLEIGRHLDHVRRTRGWEQLGVDSFERYCEKRLGIAKRSAQSSIWLYRRLRVFKRLRRAYLRGTLGYSATIELLRVVHRRTEQRWVTWATGLTCREIARVVEQVAPFAGSGGVIIATLMRAQAQLNRDPAEQRDPAAQRGAAEQSASDAQTFAAPEALERFGPPVPPTSARGCPRVPGLEDTMLSAPEALVARIFLSGAYDALAVVRRALRRCRALHERDAGSGKPDWCFLQIILVEFLLESDTPETRRFERRHPTLARDAYWCQIPSCTSRSNLQAHHIWMRSSAGPDTPWNLVTLCVAHHRMVHLGVIELGGWAPWALSIRVGVDGRTGQAHVSYRNGRRAPDDVVRARLGEWRAWCKLTVRQSSDDDQTTSRPPADDRPPSTVTVSTKPTWRDAKPRSLI